MSEEKLSDKLIVVVTSALLSAGFGAGTYHFLGQAELDRSTRELNDTQERILSRLGDLEVRNQELANVERQLAISQLLSESFDQLNANTYTTVDSIVDIPDGISFQLNIENKGRLPVHCRISNPEIVDFEFTFAEEFPEFEIDAQSKASWLVRATGGRVRARDYPSFEIDIHCAIDESAAYPIINTVREYYHPDAIDRIQVTSFRYKLNFNPP